MVRELSQGASQSQELALIHGIVKKVMVLSGKSEDRRASSRLVASLQAASKKEIVDFVTKKGSQGLGQNREEREPSLLKPRPNPYFVQ